MACEGSDIVDETTDEVRELIRLAGVKECCLTTNFV